MPLFTCSKLFFVILLGTYGGICLLLAVSLWVKKTRPVCNLYYLVLLCCITCRECRHAASCYRYSVVCLCVCLLATTVSFTETAEPIEMPFGLWTPGWGAKEPCISLGPQTPQGVDNFGRTCPVHCEVWKENTVGCRETLDVIEVPFGLWTQAGPCLPEGGAVLGACSLDRKCFITARAPKTSI